MLHEPDAIRVHIRDRTGLPFPGGGMTVNKRMISRPPVIGGGIVPDGGGAVIPVEIYAEMSVVNGHAGFVNEHKVLRRCRNGTCLLEENEAGQVGVVAIHRAIFGHAAHVGRGVAGAFVNSRAARVSPQETVLDQSKIGAVRRIGHEIAGAPRLVRGGRPAGAGGDDIAIVIRI